MGDSRRRVWLCWKVAGVSRKRHVNRHNRRKKLSPADEASADELSLATTEAKSAVPRAEYEPPRVERLGNLRELLAKTGAALDVPAHHPTRP